MHGSPFPAGRCDKAAAVEHFEHRRILRQDLGNELLEIGGAADVNQVRDEMPGYAQPLMRIVDGKRNFSGPGCVTMYLAPPTMTERPPSAEAPLRARRGS